MAKCVCVFLVLTLLVLYPYCSYSQIVVQNNYSPQYLVENILLGNGVSVSNISYNGSSLSIGSFSQGNNSSLGLSSGIVLSTGKVSDLASSNTVPNKQYNTNGGSDAQLQSLTPMNSIYDAAILEFDFVPTTDSLQFRFVFGSEEYAEWVGSNFNDVFGFFVSGQNPQGGAYSNHNIATIPGTNSPISTNTINNGLNNTGPCNNCNYYVDNTGSMTMELDGSTVVMTAKILVVPCQTYHIKIAIGDGADHSYDSGVFLEANSFSSLGMYASSTVYNHNTTNDTLHEGCDSAAIDIMLTSPLPFNFWVPIQFVGSAQNGVDFQNIPDSILIPAGVDSIRLYIRPTLDGITEGSEQITCLIPISGCSYDTFAFTLIDYNIPSVSISGPNTYCENQNVTLSGIVVGGQSPFLYNWGNGNQTTTNNFTALNDTTLYFNTTDICGNVAQAQKNIIVNTLPVVSLSSIQDSICNGDKIILMAQGAVSYAWYVNNNLVSGNTTDSLVLYPTSTSNVKVIGASQNVCSNIATKSIFVNPQITLNATPSLNSLCEGDTAVFQISGADYYQWNLPLISHSQNYDTVAYKPIISDNFWVVGVSLNGCRDSISLGVAVNNVLPINIETTYDTLCANMSTTLSTSGGISYNWWPTQSLNQSNGNIVIANPNISTTYFVEVTDLQGCKIYDSININVYDFPTVDIAAMGSPDLCIGDSIELEAHGALNYYWIINNQTIASNQSSIIYHPTHSTIIGAIGVDVFGCRDTNFQAIQINPIFNLDIPDTIVCKSENLHVSVITSNSNLTYNWSNGSNINSALYNIGSPTQISVTATNTQGCSASKSIFADVFTAQNFAISPSTQNICLGDTALIIAHNVNSMDSLFWSQPYIWASNNLDSIMVQPNQTTSYALQASDQNGCLFGASNTSNIHVYTLPDINIAPHFAEIQPNTPFLLTASGANNYQWNSSPAILSGSGTNLISISTDTLTHFYLTGTDTNGCVNYDTAIVNPRPKLYIFVPFRKICVGDSTYLTAITDVNCNYLWSTGAITQSIWVKPSVSTFYTVNVQDSLGFVNTASVGIIVYSKPTVTVIPNPVQVCLGTSTKMKASGALYYEWSPSTNLNTDIGNVVYTNTTSNITYTVIGRDKFGCADTITVPTFVVPGANVQAQASSNTVCKGEQVIMSASGTQNYNWFPNKYINDNILSTVISTPLKNIKYTVVGSNANGCFDTASITIAVKKTPELTTNTDSTNLCIGSSTQLSAHGADSYQWFPALGLSSTTDSILTANPNTTTIYTLVGTNQNSCSDSIHTYIGVHAYPNINTNPTSIQICPNGSAILTAAGADKYKWYPNTYLDTNQGVTVISNPDTNIVYQVIGRSIYGCNDTTSVSVEVKPLSIISANMTTICYGDSVLLTAYTNTSNASYQWSNGGVGQTNWFKPTSSQSITLQTTSGSCSPTTSLFIKVLPKPVVNISSSSQITCPGDPSVLIATGATIYNWTSSSNNNYYGQNVTVTPTNTTTYFVEGESFNGCKDTSSITIQTLTPPAVTVSPNFSTVCSGTAQLLIADGALNYQWYPNIGLSSSTGDSVTVIPNTNMNYMVIGADSNSCTDTAFANFTTCSNAIITPINPEVCDGENIILTATSANMPTSYLWSTGDTTQSITVSPQQNTNYSLTLTYFSGCSKVSETSVLVHHDSAVYIQASTPTICLGDYSTITATNGNSFSWTGNGLLNPSNNDTIAVSPSQSSWINVIATSINGCQSEDSVYISLYTSPPIQVASNQLTVCAGDSIQLHANGGNTYQWLNTGLSCNGCSAVGITNQTTNYSVIGFDLNHCRDTATVTVMAQALPIIQISPSNPNICPDDSILVTINGNNTYTWGNSPYKTAVNNTQTLLHPLSNTYYTIRAIDSMGCINDTMIRCDVKRKPIIYLDPDTAYICTDDSVQFIVQGASNYLWSSTPYISNITSDTVYFKPTNTTTYGLTGTSSDGCTKTIFPYIQVSPKPQITLTTNSTQYCQGDSLIISGVSANVGCSYLWNNGDTLPTMNGTINQSFEYILKGLTSDGCEDSANVYINVAPRPNILLNLFDTIICFGDSVLLQITNNQGFGLNWSNGDSTTSTYVLSTTSQAISLIATDSNNCMDTAIAQISVQQLPSVSVSSNANTICLQDSVTINAAFSDSSLTMIWNTGSFNSQIITNPIISTTYSIIASDSIGCSATDSIMITVNPAPQFSFYPSFPEVCNGDSIFLSIVSIISNLNYAWGVGASVSQVNVAPNLNTYFSVTVTDSLGCEHVDSVAVVVNQLPLISLISVPNTICEGDTAILELVSHPSIIQYSWNTGAITSTISVSPTTTTTYSITVTDTNYCVNSTNIILPVNPLPQLSIITSDTVICSQDTVWMNLVSNTPLSSVLWNTGQITNSIIEVPLSSFDYSVIGIDSNGCKAIDSTFIDVGFRPICHVTTLDSIICQGDSAIVNYLGNAGPTATYNWSFEGFPIINGSQAGPYSLNWNQEGHYYVKLNVEEKTCISFPDSIEFIVNPLPIVDISTKTNHHCDSSAVQFFSNNPGMAMYLWNFGDPLTSADTSNQQNPTYVYNVPGNYSISLSLINEFGCSASSSIDGLVDIFPKPNASFRVSTHNPDINNSVVNFFNYSTEYESQEWNFGELQSGIYNSSTENHPYHVYLGEGVFPVQLVVNNSYQCSDTASTVIVVEKDPVLFLPKGFTPNGDGLNDRFIPIFSETEVKAYEIYIYNRWGSLVYTSKDAYEGWNGKDLKTNNDCEPEVFSYVILLTDKSDVRRKYTGAVTILR